MKMSELRKLVRQVIQEAGVSAGVAGHSGAHGNDIDDFSSGPFKPDGNVTIPLRHQVDSSKEKRKSIIPQPEQTWDELDTNLEYDKVPDYAGSVFVNDTNDFKIIDWAYEYDMVDTPTKGKEGLTNDTNEYKIFGEGKSNKKKLIKEVSTTIGGTGHMDNVQQLQKKMHNAGEHMADADVAFGDAVENAKQANKNWKQHSNEEPPETTTVTQNVTTYPANPDSTHIYYDPANHPGVVSSATSTVYANKNVANVTNLISLRTVLDSVNGSVADQSLVAFDNYYGTTKTPSVPVYYNPGSKGVQAQPFGGKDAGNIASLLAAGDGSVNIRHDGVRIGSNPQFIKANELLQPLKGNIVQDRSLLDWLKLNTKTGQLSKKPAVRNEQLVAWRVSLGGQNPPVIGFSNTSRVENDAWQVDALGSGAGQASKVSSVTNQVTKTVSNPDWATWNDQLEQLELLKTEAENTERNARQTFHDKQVAYAQAQEEVEELKKERDLAFKGMGGKKSLSRSGNIVRGKAGKGRTLKGRRSRTAGGARGGVPSLAALSGMKAVKGKGKGKGKKGKDEE